MRWSASQLGLKPGANLFDWLVKHGKRQPELQPKWFDRISPEPYGYLDEAVEEGLKVLLALVDDHVARWPEITDNQRNAVLVTLTIVDQIYRKELFIETYRNLQPDIAQRYPSAMRHPMAEFLYQLGGGLSPFPGEPPAGKLIFTTCTN